jgi:DNA-directed RNA polymerase specialized sigma subunit
VIEKWADEARAAEDLAMWKQWDASGRKPEAFKPLLKRFEPMIADRARVYTGKDLMIPPAAINAEFKKQFYRAAESYEPSKGSFGTHAYSTMRAASRFITTHQNFARIPENRIFDIGEFQRVRSILEAKKDRPPTNEEMSHYMKWKLKDVKRMSQDMRKDLRSSKFEFDVERTGSSSTRSALKLVKKDLNPTDRKVLGAVLKETKIKDMSKQFKMSPSAVMRSKARIAKQLDKYMV